MNEHPASISASPPIPAADVSDLIDRWGSIGAFAADVGCGYEAARQMRRRGRIAPQHWPHVVAASRRLGIAGVSYEWLAGRAMRRAGAMQGEAA